MSDVNAEADGSGKLSDYTLLLYLAGAMQSWGSRSRFDDRDTHLEPTRSGILGLLCCAGGIGREDTETLAKINTGIERIGVRVDAPGRVAQDYHTAQQVINAAGKGMSTVLSTRHYLADARFLVAMESPDRALLEELRGWLRSPVWSLFLGRKSFPLSLPPLLPYELGNVQPGKMETVLETVPWYFLKGRMERNTDAEPPYVPLERVPDKLRVVLEAPEGESVQADVPLNFARRQFSLRRFTNCYYDCPPKEIHPCLKP